MTHAGQHRPGGAPDASESDGRVPYLQDVPLEMALERFHAALRGDGALTIGPAEQLELEQAVGRVSAAPIWALASSPHYQAAAMDGVAVAADATRGAGATTPLRLTVDGGGIWVNTGDVMPPDTDAVVMAEDVHDVGDGTVEVLAAVTPWQNVRPMGEDIVATELLLPAGHTVRPVDVAAAAAAGHATLEVRVQPRVAVVPTGSELVAAGQAPEPGQIVDTNSLMLATTARSWGAAATRLPLLPDDPEILHEVVNSELDRADIVVINAGSSAGSEDFTARVIGELGTVLVHGVAIRPGHPVVLGVARGRPLIGIPGYPVSAALAMELFVRPLIDAKLGRRSPKRPTMTAVVPRTIVSSMGDDEFVRVKVGRVGSRTIASPLSRGAGVITSMVRADGILRIPRLSEGVVAGSSVKVDLLTSREAIEHTAVIIGSHDPALDLLANEVHHRFAPAALASTNVGSQGGLIALSRDDAHAAGCHLIDPATGTYNVKDVRRLVPGRHVILVTFAHRQQGLIVAPGNPSQIHTLGDLMRDDLVFVNRQRGSGTRMLLDYELMRQGYNRASITGYDRELYTHLAVAAEVAAGNADVGLGVLAAARALDMEFVPLLQEQYDLAIPCEHYESSVLAPVLAVLRDPAFAAKVAGMGGYDVSEMGEVAAEIGE